MILIQTFKTSDDEDNVDVDKSCTTYVIRLKRNTGVANNYVKNSLFTGGLVAVTGNL